MIYRKAPPTPARLLLRITLTAGAGALLTASACSSSTNGSIPYAGSVPVACDDAACGLVADPDAASDDVTDPCTVGFCGNGSVAEPYDAADDGATGLLDAGGSDAGASDAGPFDAETPDACHMVCGSVIAPSDGGDGSVPPSCFSVCGVVSGLVANPHDQ